MPSPSDTPAAPTQHAIRRFAMQVLYQFDLRGHDDCDAIRDDICTDAESDVLGDLAFHLASDAWKSHDTCDALTTELAPDWPAHRQPPLDRALLRLAYHDITSGRTPAKVAINEVVELAKEFCAERSPAFINGVLDKMVKRIDAPESESKTETVPVPVTEKGWLDDALKATTPQAAPEITPEKMPEPTPDDEGH